MSRKIGFSLPKYVIICQNFDLWKPAIDNFLKMYFYELRFRDALASKVLSME